MRRQITEYTPSRTLARFMESDALVRLVNGPVGSGKSSGCVVEIARRAAQQKPGPDGKRRTRWAVIRNTLPQLRDTTIKTFFQWFPDGVAGDWKETTKTFTMRFGDVEAEVLFRPLDTPDDINKLLSLEISGAYINEAREIPQEIVEGLLSRIGRYPAKKDGGCTWRGIWADTNPPEMDSYWQKAMDEPPHGWEIFRQPGGLDPDAENLENLPGGRAYYEDLAASNSPEWVDVYVHARYGLGNAGKPVWRDFNPKLHIAAQRLQVPSGALLVLGMDFGLTPAASVFHQDARGRVLLVDEAVSDDMGLARFLDTRLKPLLKARYSDCDILVRGDPAGVNRSQNDEQSCYDILKRKGFRARPARSNALVPRLGAVESLLTRLIDGGAGFLVSPHCTHSIAALRGGYRYPKRRDGQAGDTPEKNMHSHIADSIQYGAMHYEEDFEHHGRRRPHGRSVNMYRPADMNAGY